MAKYPAMNVTVLHSLSSEHMKSARLRETKMHQEKFKTVKIQVRQKGGGAICFRVK